MKETFLYSHLTKTEQSNPTRTIQSFCKRNDLTHLRTQLNTWLTETLSASDTIYDNAPDRADLLYLHHQLHQLLDAIYLIHDE